MSLDYSCDSVGSRLSASVVGLMTRGLSTQATEMLPYMPITHAHWTAEYMKYHGSSSNQGNRRENYATRRFLAPGSTEKDLVSWILPTLRVLFGSA